MEPELLAAAASTEGVPPLEVEVVAPAVEGVVGPLLVFGVQRVFAMVELLAFLLVRQDFFGSGDVHELLFRLFLLLLVLEVVGVPLLGQLTVRLGHVPLVAVPLQAEDLVVVALRSLLLSLLRSLKAIFGPLEILVQL